MGLRNPKGTSSLPRERDAWAFLDAAGITSSRQQEAVITLVRDLKNANLWTKMKAIYPFVGGTATTHKWNLKDPRDVDAAFRLTFSGGWTHSSTGALPNGTNAYAATNLTPSNSITNGSEHITFYSRTDSNGLYCDMGCATGTLSSMYSIYGRYNGSAIGDLGDYLVSRISATIANTLGYYVITRTSATSVKFLKNDVSIGTNTANDTTTPPNTICMVGAIIVGTGVAQYSNRECAFATIGDGLTDTEATLLFNCVDRYQKFLGRAV